MIDFLAYNSGGVFRLKENDADQKHNLVDQIIKFDLQTQPEVEPGILHDFWFETKEHLDKIEMNVLALETELGNMEMIHSLLREFHTIKGLAGFVNHQLIQRIAHQIETRLDDCRKGKREISQEDIDLILAASDYLKRFCEDPALSMNPEYICSIETFLKNVDVLSDEMKLDEFPASAIPEESVPPAEAGELAKTDGEAEVSKFGEAATPIYTDAPVQACVPVEAAAPVDIGELEETTILSETGISVETDASKETSAAPETDTFVETDTLVNECELGDTGEFGNTGTSVDTDEYAEASALAESPQPPFEPSIIADNEAEYLQTFIDETQSYLDIFESALLQFEKEPENKDIVNNLFRSMHTIKGMASAMGFVNLTAFTHGIENLLQAIRDDQLTANPNLIQLLFLGRDHLTDSLQLIIQTGKEAELKQDGLLDKLREIQNQLNKGQIENGDASATGEKIGEPPLSKLEIDSAFVSESITGILECVKQIELKLLLLETAPEDPALILSILDYFQLVNRLAHLVAAEPIRNIARQGAVLLKKSISRESPITRKMIDWLLESAGYIKQFSADSGLNESQEFDARVAAHLDQFPVNEAEILEIDDEASTPIQKLGDILIEQKKLTLTEVTELLAKQKADAPELRLGQIGIKEGKITPGVLRESLKIQQESLINHIPVGSQSNLQNQNAPGDHFHQKYEADPSQAKPVKKIGEILVARNTITQEQLAELLQRQKELPQGLKLGQLAVAEKKAEPDDIIKSLRAQEHEFKAISAESDNVRVSITKVDNLVDMVGELLIIQSLIEQEAGKHFDTNDYFMTNLLRMTRISKDIQNMSMSLRMISLKSTFQKINRVARDAITQLGKNISFQMTGEETEIDRGVAEKLLDPLIHLVKNAISHGIEPESVRTAQGKPAQGLVKVEASSKRGYIFIAVSDDGKGMDYDAIRSKALEKKLIEPGGTYSPDEILNLVFLPGFSTAETIDNISGRGVGLDVVKTELQKTGGKVEINSQQGQGSVFTLKIPINFAVFNGIIISIQEMNFIIPSQNVRRIVQIQPDQWVKGSGKKMIAIQDEAFPVIPIFNALGLKSAESAKLVVILELEETLKALPVHGIVGKREIVLKPLGNEFSELQWIAGASILGDGKVSLILDIENIFRMEEDMG